MSQGEPGGGRRARKSREERGGASWSSRSLQEEPGGASRTQEVLRGEEEPEEGAMKSQAGGAMKGQEKQGG